MVGNWASMIDRFNRIIEIIVMVKNNHDVNYLHSSQEKLHFMILILGQMSCQNCHNPNNIIHA